jgi:hypothetical protein
MKYTKKNQNCTKFEQGVLNNVERHHKKIERKKTKKKKNSSPSAKMCIFFLFSMYLRTSINI